MGKMHYRLVIAQTTLCRIESNLQRVSKIRMTDKGHLVTCANCKAVMTPKTGERRQVDASFETPRGARGYVLSVRD